MLQMTYARFFPGDWRKGCFSLNLEEEGLYIRCCAFMYATGQPVPGDDTVASRLMNLDVRIYRRVMRSLIEKGKMIWAQGVLINERVVEEMDRFRLEQAKRSEAAKKREVERKARIQRDLENAINKHLKPSVRTPTSAEDREKKTDKSAVSSGTPAEEVSEKINKISDALAEPCQSGGTNSEAQKLKDENIELSSNEESVADATIAPQYLLECFQAYNDLAQRVGIPIARTFTPERRKSMRARLKDHGGPGAWKLLLNNIERSAFLQGKIPGKTWKPTGLDWFLSPRNFCKVIEGAYGNGAHVDEPKESTAERFARLLSEIDDETPASQRETYV